MRIFAILFCLIGFLNAASAQAPAKPVKNLSELAKWELYYIKYHNPSYVVDEEYVPDSSSRRIVGGLDPYAILKTTIVETGTLKTRYVVYIVTNLKKITAYQKKFGAFSNEYRNFLAAHQNRDAHYRYYVDGALIKGFRPDVTDILCAIPAGKIKEVNFKADNKAADFQMVSITTKQ
jgi:hypothetical protein